MRCVLDKPHGLADEVVRGFGGVYLDVDTDHTAFEFFDIDDVSLGTFATPVAVEGFPRWIQKRRGSRDPRLKYHLKDNLLRRSFLPCRR